MDPSTPYMSRVSPCTAPLASATYVLPSNFQMCKIVLRDKVLGRDQMRRYGCTESRDASNDPTRRRAVCVKGKTIVRHCIAVLYSLTHSPSLPDSLALPEWPYAVGKVLFHRVAPLHLRELGVKLRAQFVSLFLWTGGGIRGEQVQ